MLRVTLAAAALALAAAPLSAFASDDPPGTGCHLVLRPVAVFADPSMPTAYEPAVECW